MTGTQTRKHHQLDLRDNPAGFDQPQDGFNLCSPPWASEPQAQRARFASLARHIRHELATPLSAALLRCNYLLQRFSEGLPEREEMLRVFQDLRRIERVVTGLNEIAHPPEPEWASADPRRVMSEALAPLAPSLRAQGITTRWEILAEETLACRLDANQIRKVLRLLIRNAAELLGLGGEIVLRVRNDQGRLGGYPVPVVIMEIVGHTPTAPQRFGDHSLDPSLIATKRNLGLEWAVAAQILETHHGTLDLQSAPRRGFTFHIALPVDGRSGPSEPHPER